MDALPTPSGRPGVTTGDIATYVGRSRDRVRAWTTLPEWKQEVAVVGRRGRAHEYHPGQVMAVLRRWIWLPPHDTTFAHDQLLVPSEISAYSGYPLRQVHSDISKGVLPDPDAVSPEAAMWRRSTVDACYWGRQRRTRTTHERTNHA